MGTGTKLLSIIGGFGLGLTTLGEEGEEEGEVEERELAPEAPREPPELPRDAEPE
jgi:hypothetical protein